MNLLISWIYLVIQLSYICVENTQVKCHGFVDSFCFLLVSALWFSAKSSIFFFKTQCTDRLVMDQCWWLLEVRMTILLMCALSEAGDLPLKSYTFFFFFFLAWLGKKLISFHFEEQVKHFCWIFFRVPSDSWLVPCSSNTRGTSGVNFQKLQSSSTCPPPNSLISVLLETE